MEIRTEIDSGKEFVNDLYKTKYYLTIRQVARKKPILENS